ncbi:MAG: selenide, water dikinase SelD [Christensenellaceae bacterium]|nr:selenide, water dikinase SelD [Christensenellaceae bacterium]
MDDVKLTKLASCAGCGAKVGAGTLAKLLDGLPTVFDERLIVGYDKSDDASVYVINDELALVQTVDFFPPIADDPFLFGQIAAANALSDVYAMGGEPKLAMNIMCVCESMGKKAIHDVLRGGYDKAYEAGVIITGGHTIEDKEPKYGLAVTGFVHPGKVLSNSSACEGDVLILTKPLGIGILTTAAKADLVDDVLMKKVHEQMIFLNKTARNIMVNYEVHGCTDVTGFSLMGHSLEMAKGSELTLNIQTSNIPYHKEALEFASMGFVPAGAYRNREFAESEVYNKADIPRAMQDILFDPQTSGGLLIAVSQKDACALLKHLQSELPCAEQIGYVTDYHDNFIILE